MFETHAKQSGKRKNKKTKKKSQQRHSSGVKRRAHNAVYDANSRGGKKQRRGEGMKRGNGASARSPKAKLSSLQDRFLKKLKGAKFRKLNEDLYTTPGESSFSRFQDDPSLFVEYHEGFREQARSWPQNPLDRIIKEIKTTSKALVVGDFGCGDAALAQSVPNRKVHSFDLVAVTPLVTACNIATVPLSDSTLDIGVFCLALMGTDYQKFLIEAHRVLKTGGTLFIAEVESRFCPPAASSGSGGVPKHKDEAEEKKRRGKILNAGLSRFLKMTKEIGFDFVQRYPKTPFFVLLKLKKAARPSAAVVSNPFEFKACVYKKR
jgi:ribosomal RNA-processing protein 8